MHFKSALSALLSKPFYFLLLPVFFVLHGFMEHQGLIDYADAFILLLSYLGTAIVVVFLFRFLFSDISKAALATFAGFFIFFFFGTIHDFLKQSGPVFFSRYGYLLPSLFLLYLFFVFGLRRKNLGKRHAVYLNVLLVLLIVTDLVAVAWNATRNKTGGFVITERPGVAKPDVYLLMLDEYAGEEQLQQIFRFSNNQFLDSLSALGFQIAKSSASNYSATPFSMASLLSMSYHLELKNFKYTDENLNYCYKKISQSNVVSGFKSLGYQFVNYSIFDFKSERSIINKTFLKSGIELITTQTLWSRVKRDLWDNFIANHMGTSSLYDDLIMKDHKNNELLYEKTLQEAKSRSVQPRFIYTHLLMPHFPYYFNAEGKLNDKKLMLGSENMYNQELYIGYLQYANQRVLHLVNEIIRADKSAVILLLSDHGYRYANDPSFIFLNLSAIYDPRNIVSSYPYSSSNVNVFRRLFNDLFDAQLPFLVDKQYK